MDDVKRSEVERVRFSDEVREMELAVGEIRKCFISGSSVFQSKNSGEKHLCMDNLYSLLQFTVAYYSWCVSVWGSLKSDYEAAEQRRKLREGEAFITAKREKGGTVDTAKAEAALAVEAYYDAELAAGRLFNRAGACKSALEAFMKSIDSLKYMKNKEWSASE